ncbi:MAG: hypothetical protein ACRDRJ_24060 [Streptosporangiaceae bacterium]
MSPDRAAAGGARQWQEMAGHLVQAHGGDPSALMSYALMLEQLHFAHAGTHVMLASIGAQPPDRHTHPLPMNAGWPDAGQPSGEVSPDLAGSAGRAAAQAAARWAAGVSFPGPAQTRAAVPPGTRARRVQRSPAGRAPGRRR